MRSAHSFTPCVYRSICICRYALNHPTVSYCQGMSDIASPLLVVMTNEAHAYICLCALMSRLHPNFLLDGEAMTLKFAHLTESLQIYDPMFYAYLQSQQVIYMYNISFSQYLSIASAYLLL